MKKQFKKKSGNEIAVALEAVRAGAQKGNRVCKRIEAGLPKTPRVISAKTLLNLGYEPNEETIVCAQNVALIRLHDTDSGREAKFSMLVDVLSHNCIVVDLRQSELFNALKEAA